MIEDLRVRRSIPGVQFQDLIKFDKEKSQEKKGKNIKKQRIDKLRESNRIERLSYIYNI